MRAKLLLRAGIPWGGIFLVGGLLLVFATDVPEWIGWVAVAYGILNTIVQFIALTIIGLGLKALTDATDMDKDTFLTNYGRKREVTR